MEERKKITRKREVRKQCKEKTTIPAIWRKTNDGVQSPVFDLCFARIEDLIYRGFAGEAVNDYIIFLPRAEVNTINEHTIVKLVTKTKRIIGGKTSARRGNLKNAPDTYKAQF